MYIQYTIHDNTMIMLDSRVKNTGGLREKSNRSVGQNEHKKIAG